MSRKILQLSCHIYNFVVKFFQDYFYMKGCQVSYTVIYTLYHLQLAHNSVKLSVLANCCLLITSIKEILDFLEKLH